MILPFPRLVSQSILQKQDFLRSRRVAVARFGSVTYKRIMAAKNVHKLKEQVGELVVFLPSFWLIVPHSLRGSVVVAG